MPRSRTHRLNKEPKRAEKKELSYFSINEETPTPHLHQLNEGVKRTEHEGKLISA
jgi:hypothetical protein